MSDSYTELNVCTNCAAEMASGQVVCPRCGFNNGQRQNPVDVLPEGTILNGKYLICRMLGRGGFGVTYLGYDVILKIRVAIKEYLPVGISFRVSNSLRVTAASSQDNGKGFEEGCRAFQEEARLLARFSSPNIVRVREYFRENGTAYIVMDFVDGADLSKEIQRCGGRMPWERVIALFTPLMKEMEKLHAENLIHRDIKPDNIRVVKDGDSGEEHLVLLDFGSARRFVSENVTHTYTAMVTPGYAPIEQYNRTGRQGPFTDVYSLCATMYAAITGVCPPASTEISAGDAKIPAFTSMGVSVPANVENAIMHGLAFLGKDRPQTMNALYNEICGIGGGAKLPDNEWKNRAYNDAINAMASGTLDGYKIAQRLLKGIPGWKDADRLAEECKRRIKELDKNPPRHYLIAIPVAAAFALCAVIFFVSRSGRLSAISGLFSNSSGTPVISQILGSTRSTTSVPAATAVPTNTPRPAATAVPTSTREPAATAIPTSTRKPAATATPTRTPRPTATNTPQGQSYYDQGWSAYLKGDYSSAMSYYKQAAALGHLEAMHEIGDLYDLGYGVTKNEAEAYKWYLKAAELGHAESQYDVYKCYRWGNGVMENSAEALKWFKKAAENKNGSTYYAEKLGNEYLEGEFVARNPSEAVKWYRLSAERGRKDSMIKLGNCYEFGIGVSKNIAEAEKWYKQAESFWYIDNKSYSYYEALQMANSGDAEAQCKIGRWFYSFDLYSNDEFAAETIKWLRKAATAGNANGQYEYGYCFKYGHGTLEKDEAAAFSWFQKAANQGNADAMWELYMCYKYGDGVEKNESMAAYWNNRYKEAR